MESHHRIPGPVDFVPLTLDAKDLVDAAIELTGLPLAVIGGKIPRMPEQHGAWLVSVIEAATRVAETTPGIFTSPQAADALEHALLRPMIMGLSDGDGSDPTMTRPR
jgi:hypothetical protein